MQIVEHPYQMSISLNVLNHLGIGLYSNVPAVLSEVVANAWDADARNVTIDIHSSRHEIIIYDDGNGMTASDINGKYLYVGYQKRIHEPGRTAAGRDPMGRKGIGKLSVFSIADTVEIYTVKHGERNALSMNSGKIKAQIESEGEGKGTYFPDPIDADQIDFDRGTRIILRDLRKNVTTTAGFLRRRLARRFSIIGTRQDFRVNIDGFEVTTQDRNYYDNIEFLWYFGPINDGFMSAQEDGLTLADSAGRPKLLPNVRESYEIDNVVDAGAGYTATGWIGTVDEQRNIDEDNNTIVVFANGKLIQEDVLKDLKESGVYSKYLIGEIDANFMDSDTEDDIVTSSHQSVKEDDIRYEALKKFVQAILKRIQSQWRDLRNEKGSERALQHLGLRAWYDAQRGDNRSYAKQLFGKIESLRIPDPEAKKEMYKSCLLSFEMFALKNQLSILDSLETKEDFDVIAKIFRGIDDIEAVHYYQIVKGRIEIVKEFERVLPHGRERLIQAHIFDHLWLLDPSWERAASNPRLEESVTTEFGRVDAGLTDEEKKGRIDIRYRTAAGKYIIIELKKFDRPVKIYDLLEQVRKYQDALRKVIATKFPGDRAPTIESICILGSPPLPPESDTSNRRLLSEVGARYLTYDELIAQTRKSYEEYLAREKAVSALIATIDSLDDTFAIPSTSSPAPGTARA